MSCEIDMEVIMVVAIMLGSEHGGKLTAPTIMDIAQEGLLALIASPAAFDHDLATVSENETRDVEGIRVAVLRELGPVHVVHWPAGIGRCNFDLGYWHAEVVLSRRPNSASDPAIDLGNHRAAKERRRIECHPAVIGGGHLERMLGSAVARPAERGSRMQELALGEHAGREARILLLRPPSLVLGDEIGSGAAAG